jgi:hypothetical protein
VKKRAEKIDVFGIEKRHSKKEKSQFFIGYSKSKFRALSFKNKISSVARREVPQICVESAARNTFAVRKTLVVRKTLAAHCITISHYISFMFIMFNIISISLYFHSTFCPFSVFLPFFLSTFCPSMFFYPLACFTSTFSR